MPISKTDLEAALVSAFPNAKITITALAGDNDHWSAEVVDESFAELSRIAQHKLVQKAVEKYDIHALQIKTAAA